MTHPVSKITRLGPSGYGVQREGSFAGKSTSRPVGTITRLGESGYGVRRYAVSAFAGKPLSANVSEYQYFARHRGRR